MLMVELRAEVSSEEAQAVADALAAAGAEAGRIARVDRGFVCRVPDAEAARARVSGMPGVGRAIRVETPYVLSAREAAASRSVVSITPRLSIGGDEFVVIAGPCSVETPAQTLASARAVKAAGARALRGGAFKPRTSPFSFQGLGEKGLEILARVREETGLPIVSEVLGASHVEALERTADVIQVGMRNALNYALLKQLGRLESRRPILLKCGIGTSLDEFLCAADYLLAGGNRNVILCLRGTVGFSQQTRCAMNIVDIPVLRAKTHLPIVVDPCHAAGRWSYVPSIAAAALVAGADGLLVEVHEAPERALSDAEQSLKPERFHRLMRRLRAMARLMGRTMAPEEGTLPEPEGHPMEALCLEAPG